MTAPKEGPMIRIVRAPLPKPEIRAERDLVRLDPAPGDVTYRYAPGPFRFFIGKRQVSGEEYRAAIAARIAEARR